jgi:hypothetical protein
MLAQCGLYAAEREFVDGGRAKVDAEGEFPKRLKHVTR